MYNSYFGFSSSPFDNNLNTRFVFFSKGHHEALAALFYFLKTNKPLAMICGDVGTGKTILVNTFIKRLVPNSVRAIMISNPYLTSHELLRYIAQIMDIEADEKQGIIALTNKIKSALMDPNSLQQQLLLIVDEAHLLSDQTLEEIRLLSNLETDDRKLLQILLVGSDELSQKLDRPEMRQLRQRLTINRSIFALSAVEAINYIDYRLKKAGSSFASCFKSNCRNLIHKMTGGIPRRINQVCDNALLICVAEDKRKVNRKILRKAGQALQTGAIFTPQRVPRWRGLLKPLIPIAVGLTVLMGITFIYLGFGIIRKSSPTLSVASNLENSAPVELAKASLPLPHTVFLANRGGKAYHYPGCVWVKHTPRKELRKFSSADQALRAGFKPCRRCNPPRK